MLVNARTREVLARRVEQADSFASRFFGLMGRAGLPEDEALVLAPCQSVHMLFMRFALDVVFADRQGVVVAVYQDLRPWRVSGFHRQAHFAIELPVGAVARTGTQVGDTVEMDAS